MRVSVKIPIQICRYYFFGGGSQNSRVSQLPARISPSSDGVEIKTGYVRLPTRRDLSRRLVFRVIQETKLIFCCRSKKKLVSGK